MIQARGIPLLLGHFLTSYFLDFIKYKLEKDPLGTCLIKTDGLKKKH